MENIGISLTAKGIVMVWALKVAHQKKVFDLEDVVRLGENEPYDATPREVEMHLQEIVATGDLEITPGGMYRLAR